MLGLTAALRREREVEQAAETTIAPQPALPGARAALQLSLVHSSVDWGVRT